MTEFSKRKIGELANQIRNNSLKQIPVSQFSTLCLDFDVSIPATSEYGRVIKVIQLLSTRRDPRTVKLAIIWLDTKGFGDKSMQWLVGMILRETRSACQ